MLELILKNPLYSKDILKFANYKYAKLNNTFN